MRVPFFAMTGNVELMGVYADQEAGQLLQATGFTARFRWN
jgi:hypothetical protein